VTEAPLGSMGQPIAVTVKDRKVFLCCRGCEASLKANPEKFLARLHPASAREAR
jgi:Cu(I)/Ag(I) efflux system membrane fusion protein